MVKYSDELKQHLEEPFCETPTKPWKGKSMQIYLFYTFCQIKDVTMKTLLLKFTLVRVNYDEK